MITIVAASQNCKYNPNINSHLLIFVTVDVLVQCANHLKMVKHMIKELKDYVKRMLYNK